MAIQLELIFGLVMTGAQLSLLLAHKVINKFCDKGNMYGADVILTVHHR